MALQGFDTKSWRQFAMTVPIVAAFCFSSSTREAMLDPLVVSLSPLRHFWGPHRGPVEGHWECMGHEVREGRADMNVQSAVSHEVREGRAEIMIFVDFDISQIYPSLFYL